MFVCRKQFKQSSGTLEQSVTYFWVSEETQLISTSKQLSRVGGHVFHFRLALLYILNVGVSTAPKLVLMMPLIVSMWAKITLHKSSFSLLSQPFTSSSTSLPLMDQQGTSEIRRNRTDSLTLDDVTWASCQSFHGLKHSMHGISDL